MQPALTLAYLATYALPFSFRNLSSDVAGILIGLSLTITSLIHFRCRRKLVPTVPSSESHRRLHEPLIALHESRVTYQHDGCGWIVLFAVSFGLADAVTERELSSILILGMNVYAVLFDVTGLSVKEMLGIVFAACVIRVALQRTGVWFMSPAHAIAIMSGILFGSVASYSLPLWDSKQPSSIGFCLSSAALLTLFIGASTIELIS